MNWDDLKILLALSRFGSTRKAAQQLGVSNTTVMRRLDSLEEALSGKLFDRTPDGFKPTALANQMLPIAREVEESLTVTERRVMGMDAELHGTIKLSLPLVPVDRLVTALAEFARRYPRIELDVSASDEPVDLARREADIAVRAIAKHKRPPKDIVGIKLGPISIGYYVHKQLLSEASRGLRELTYIRNSLNRLALGDLTSPENLDLNSRHLIDGVMLRLMAVKHQLGVAALPSFVTAEEPDVILLPGIPLAHWGYVWLLHHKDLRQSARVRALFKQLSGLEADWHQDWGGEAET